MPKRQQQAMTVGELIEQLQQFDSEMPVKFSYDYGDHWHTNVAPNVRNVTTEFTKYSEYHNMDMIDEDGESEENECVVIS